MSSRQGVLLILFKPLMLSKIRFITKAVYFWTTAVAAVCDRRRITTSVYIERAATSQNLPLKTKKSKSKMLLVLGSNLTQTLIQSDSDGSRQIQAAGFWGHRDFEDALVVVSQKRFR